MYPQELLPRKSYESPITDASSLFVRTLKEFPSDCLDGHEFLPEIVDEILKPNGDIEIYSLSLFLYGTYNEKHFDIVVTDKEYFSYWDGEEELNDIPFERKEQFGIFLKADVLKNKTIVFENNKQQIDRYTLHYEHKPTRSNYWHFELFVTKNEDDLHVPRKKRCCTRSRCRKNKRRYSVFCCL